MRDMYFVAMIKPDGECVMIVAATLSTVLNIAFGVSLGTYFLVLAGCKLSGFVLAFECFVMFSAVTSSG